MTLTKSDLINKLHASPSNISKVQAREAIEALLEIMKSALADGDNLMLSEFGKFSVRDKAPRKGRNPHTGESIMLEARRVVTFKPSGKLREKINRK